MSAVSTLHYAWCTRHGAPLAGPGQGFCEGDVREVDGVELAITSGSVNGVPGVDLYARDVQLTPADARRLATLLQQVADALEAEPLPIVRRAEP